MAKKKIRVLRIIEYTYENVDSMIEDQRRWTNHFHIPGHILMESVAFPLETLQKDED